MRESPSLKIIETLENKGAEVDYNDPYIPRPPKMREHKLEKDSVALTAENLAKYDCVVIATNHSVYDGEFILKNSQLIIDTRNVIKNHTNHSDKVKRA